MEFERYGYVNRFLPSGRKIQSEEFCVEFDRDGEVLRVFVWNEFLGGWFYLEFESLSRPHQKKVKEFVENALVGIKSEGA